MRCVLTFKEERQLTNGYAYDAASNRVSLTDPAGGVSTYSYDSLNRLTGLANSNSGNFGFGYDALGRRTSLTRPNGVGTSYSYDTLSRLLGVLHNGGSLPGSAGYTYDAAGNRLSKTAVQEANPNPVSVTSNYSYDSIYELTQAVVGGTLAEGYTYDAVGNRLTSAGPTSYSYNASNELTSTSAATYTYDSNGNTLTKTDSTGTIYYAWDYENRLTSVTLPGTGGTVNFMYDPFGRRIEKIAAAGTTIYAYDGDNVIEELGGGGNLLAHYTQGAGIDEPLSLTEAGGTYFYHEDGLGSITSLTDGSGQVAASYVYDSFGKLTASTGTITNPFQYTGREFDTETGLYYYRARHYDSTAGRFLSEDPIGFYGGTNFYRYARNRPQYFRDPSGKLTIRPGFSPQCLADLLSGIQILRDRIKSIPSCNCFFLSHGMHAPLDVFLGSPLFAVGFDPNGNEGKGEEDTLAYVQPGNPFDVFITPEGCASGPTHIAQDLAHEFAHLSLGHASTYYKNHPLPENPDHALARQAEAACGFPIQTRGTTITVHP